MKLTTKLFASAGLIWLGALVERWRHQRLLGRAHDDDDLGDLGAVVIMDMEIVGIADVDPGPMTQTSGEGIDPDVPVPPRIR